MLGKLESLVEEMNVIFKVLGFDYLVFLVDIIIRIRYTYLIKVFKFY